MSNSFNPLLLDNPTRGTTDLLASCVPPSTSDQINPGTTPGDDTGTPGFNFSRFLKQWAADTNANMQQIANFIAVTTGGFAYQGVWNASTNIPALASGQGVINYVYKVSVAGSTTLDGTSVWNVGDFAFFDGTTWDKLSGGAFTTINNLPAGTALTGTENVAIYQGGQTVEVPTSYFGALPLYTTPVIATGTATTDYANLFAAFNSAVGDSTGNYRVVTLYGQFTINQKIVVTMKAASNIQQGPFQIIGYGDATINVSGSNLGCLEFQAASSSTPHGISIENFNVNYTTAQTSSNVASVAIGFRTVSGTANSPTFLIYLDRIEIQAAYRGIANVETSGQYSMSEMTITRCSFGQCAGSSIYLVSPTSIGQPLIKIDHVYIGSVASSLAEPVIQVDACDSLLISQVEFGDITNLSVLSITSSNFNIQRCKLETCTYSSNSSPVLFFANSTGTLDGFSLQNVSLTATNLNLIQQNTGQSYDTIDVRSIIISIASGTGTLSLFTGSGARFIMHDQPAIESLGTGPAVVRVQYSGGSTVSNNISFSSSPGGEMSDDQGDASVIWNPLTSPKMLVFNTPLTANRTVTLTAGPGSTIADNCWDGAQCTVVRTANSTGSFTLTVLASIPATKLINPGSAATFKYRRSFGGFVETDNSSL
jgi:hypothetical protein